MDPGRHQGLDHKCKCIFPSQKLLTTKSKQLNILNLQQVDGVSQIKIGSFRAYRPKDVQLFPRTFGIKVSPNHRSPQGSLTQTASILC